VVIENDVRAAALGSYHRLLPTFPHLSDLVYLSLGTGISAGVIVDGRLHRGSRGIAGEIGHAPLGEPTMTCTCGLTGCLEAVAGGRALDDRVEGGARRLFDDPRHDPAETHRVVAAVARAVHVLTAVFDPDLFVLGGGIAIDAAPEIRDALAGMASVSPFGEAVLDPDRVVTLPPDADVGTAGAAMLGSRFPVGDPQTSSALAAERTGGTK
jgi:predicted NBD/HSP70 family sugar kinase